MPPRKASHVWLFFEKSGDNARCIVRNKHNKECGQVLSLKNASTSTLLKHLKFCHKEQHLEVERLRGALLRGQQTLGESTPTTVTSSVVATPSPGPFPFPFHINHIYFQFQIKIRDRPEPIFTGTGTGTGTEISRNRNRNRNQFWPEPEPEPELASKSVRFFELLLVKFYTFYKFSSF